MSYSREIKTIFAIDGQQKYTDAIKNINSQQYLLRAELKKITAEYKLNGDKQGELRSKIEFLNKQMDLQKQKVAESRAAMEHARTAYKENSDATNELTAQYYAAEAGLSDLQAKIKSANKDLVLQESKLRAAGEAAEKTGKKMQTVGDNMSKAGTAMSIGLTAPIVAAAGYATKAAMDYESAFAGVIKTVDGTKEQLDELSQGIRDMSKEVPTAASDIAKVSEAAGQLGIQTENVLGFTKVMVDLGEATNLTATEGASQLAQFANITQMSQKDFDRLGSSIVSLGNNSATTEADIVSMAMRLAGAGKQVGMTEADILGISAALSSVGIDAEAGGSAISKVMVEMQLAVLKGGKPLEDFAHVAGMPAKEFARAYEEDAAGALTAFISGLGSLDDKGGSAIQTLDDMGITEVRMRDALLRSAGAGDLLASSIELSSQAWEENNALTKEAGQRYATSESQIKMAKNRITDAAITIGQQLLPVLADAADSVASAAEAFGNMSPEMQKASIIALGVVAAVGPIAKTLGVVTSVTGKATEAIGKYSVKLAEKKAAEVAATAATNGLASASSTAATAGTGLLAVAGPLAIAALAVGAAYIIFKDRTGELTEETNALIKACEDSKSAFETQSSEAGTNAEVSKKLSDELFTLSDKENKTNAEKTKMVGLVNQLNTLIPELSLTIDEQTGALSKNKAETDKLIKSKLEDIKMQAAQQRLLELYKEDVELAEKMKVAQEKLTKAKNKGTSETIAYMNAYFKSGGVLADYVSETDDAQAAIDVLTQAQKDNKAGVGELEKVYGEMATGVEKANEDVVDSGQKTVELTQEQLNQQAADREEYESKMKQSVQDHLDEMGSIDQYGIDRSKLTADEVKKNLDKQVEDYRDWRQGIKDLAGLIPDDVLAELEELGPGADQIIDDLKNMSPEKRAAWIESWRAPAEEAEKAAIDELGKGPADAAIAGANTGFAFVNALNSAVSGIEVDPVTIPVKYFGSKMDLPKLPGFAVGTKYLPEDMVILAHQGEMIVPKSENPYANSNGPVLNNRMMGNLAVSPDVTFDGSKFNQTALNNAAMSSMASAAKLAAAGNKVLSGGSQPAASGQMVHSGKIEVIGVNNQGEIVGSREIIMDELRRDFMMSGK